MRTILRVLVVPAVAWAIVPPASYGLLFAAVKDASAFIDFALVVSCVVLGFAAFKRISVPIWITAFAIVTVFSFSGFVHHFRDSGESGPLPFEWINSYFIHAMPLILISILMQAITPKTAEQGRGANALPRAAHD